MKHLLRVVHCWQGAVIEVPHLQIRVTAHQIHYHAQPSPKPLALSERN